MTTINDIITQRINPSFSQKEFEELYIASRKKENRLYTDEQVAQLPLIENTHPHFNEWQLRKRSAARLMNYLGNKDKPLSVLEAGCGNGWLSAGLVGIKAASVTGTDINKTELEQARKVFAHKKKLHFIEGDIRNIKFNHKFDIIVFAASIQYFSNFEEIIEGALWLLNEAGEIHILDSYFYKETAIEHATQRSQLYYQSIGHPEMAACYFHHSIDSLRSFNYELLYNPAAFKNKLLGKKDPFPWICIKAS